MTGVDDNRPTDAELRSAIRATVPPHTPEFWDSLQNRLEGIEGLGRPSAMTTIRESAPADYSATARLDPTARRRARHRWAAVGLVAAAVAGVVTVGAMVLRPDPVVLPPAQQPSAPAVTDSTPTPDQTPVVADLAEVDGEQLARQLRALGADVPGTAQPAAYQWDDVNGRMSLILTVGSDEGPPPADSVLDGLVSADDVWDWPALDVVLIAERDGTADVVRTLHEPSDKGCVFGDVEVGYLDGSVTLSDSDQDGVAEVSVGWFAGCAHEPEISTTKLALLEGSDKYILRGTGFPAERAEWATRFDANPQSPEGILPGERIPATADPVEDLWPVGALDHATEVYGRVVF